MVIIDTCIDADVSKNTLDAFLYGQVTGTYKLYKELNSKKLSIRFDNDEDATAFKLKALDEIFNKKFNDKMEALRGIFDNVSYKSATGPTATEWLSGSKYV